jgi:hypothetical protein
MQHDVIERRVTNQMIELRLNQITCEITRKGPMSLDRTKSKWDVPGSRKKGNTYE